MPRKQIPPGTLFTRLEVVSAGPVAILPCGQKQSQSWCRCTCGNPVHFLVRNGNLKFGTSKSCGCLQKDSPGHCKHGHSPSRAKPSRTYTTWAGVLSRCTNQNEEAFKNYGGRGIRVCNGFQSFPGFLSAMGERPAGLTIHRVNNDGHYSCGRCAECLERGWQMNCVWATRKVQMRHTRRSRVLTVRGITASLAELCERFGMPYRLIQDRIFKLKWTEERAFFTPKLQ